MPVNNSIRIEGAAEALKVLNKAAPDIVREINKDLKAAVKPVVQDAKQLLPRPSALTNWGQWITPSGRDLSFDAGKARRGVKAATRRTPERDLRSNYGGRRYKVIPLLELRQTDPAGAIYERAGAKTSTRLGRSLNRKHGSVSIDLGNTLSGRALYPAFFRRENGIMRDVRTAVHRIETETTKRLST